MKRKEEKMNWIEVHDAKSDGEFFINVEHIESVYMEEPVSGRFVTTIDVGNDSRYYVKETYEEVKNKIFYGDEYQYGTTSN